MARYELKRIGLFSVVKTSFLLGAITGFVFGIIEWAVLGFFMWAGENMPFGGTVLDEANVGELLGTGMGVMGVMLPFMGAFFGAVGGVIFGFLTSVFYNLGARLWGGLEFEWSGGRESVTVSPMPPAAAGEAIVSPLPGPTTPPGGDRDRESPRSSSAMYE